MDTATEELIFEDLLSRFDMSSPRYTPYPTADHFVEAFTAEDYMQALALRRTSGSGMRLPLSLAIPILFLPVS